MMNSFKLVQHNVKSASFIENNEKEKKKDIDDITSKYLANYLYVVKSKNVLPPSVSFDEIVNNVLRFERI